MFSTVQSIIAASQAAENQAAAQEAYIKRANNVCEDRRTVVEKILAESREQTELLKQVRNLLVKQNQLWDEYAAREGVVNKSKSVQPFSPGDVVIDSRDGKSYVVMAYDDKRGIVKVLGKSADISTKFFVPADFHVQL